MSLKGTLDTFSLQELLQMLAFNQKVGTLVLETDSGTAALYLSRGRVSFFASDPTISEWMGRLAKRTCRQPRRLEQAVRDQEESRRYMGNILLQMQLFTEQEVRDLYTEVAADRLFNIQAQEIHSFEFREGISVGPDGSASSPLDPLMQVDALLLDLTRKMDHWETYREQVTSLNEVYEQTGEAFDPKTSGDIDASRAVAVLHAVDGSRSVHHVAQTSGVDLFSTVQVLTLLLDHDVIRLTSTESLYERVGRAIEAKDAHTSAALLGALAGRDDAPRDVPLLESEAYESLGDLGLAASALERYAALDHDDRHERFRALHRAASLRQGDVASWLRVCDEYLEHRDELIDEREAAAEAVHISARLSMEQETPLEAAARLSAFVRHGDVRAEERVLLADLYAAGDDIEAAAKTLCVHGDDILSAGRTSAALAVYRRALRMDSQCLHARKRIASVEPGLVVPRRSMIRRLVTAALIPILLAAAGYAGWKAMKRTGKTVDVVAERTKILVAGAEGRGGELIAAFQKQVEEAATQGDGYDALKESASTLRERIQQATSMDDGEIESMAESLDDARRGGTSVADQIREAIDDCQEKADTRVTQVLTALHARCERALDEGKKAHADGRFKDAYPLLREAHGLSVHNEDVHLLAKAQYKAVSGYLEKYEAVREAMTSAEVAGDLRGAYVAGIEGIRELLGSDVSRSLRFPVEVTSTPPGAQIYIGGKNTGERTPTVVHYSPMDEDTFLQIRLPGYTTFEVELPTLSHATRSESTAHEWENTVDCTLSPGCSALIQSNAAPDLTRVWSSGDRAFVLAGEGHVIFEVDTKRNHLIEHSSTPGYAQTYTSAGSMKDGFQWTLSDDETLEVHRGDGLSWRTRLTTPMVGQPVHRQGVVMVATASGKIFGLDAKTGGLVWQKALPSRPRHGLKPTPIGVAVMTERGQVMLFHAANGKSETLAPARDMRAGTVRLGRGILVVGSGRGGLQFFLTAGQPEVLSPMGDIEQTDVVSSGDAAAWVADRGVVAVLSDKREPIAVTGLPAAVKKLVVADLTLYALESGGEAVTAVSLAEPAKSLWRCPLPHPAKGAMAVVGPHLLVVTESGLAVIER